MTVFNVNVAYYARMIGQTAVLGISGRTVVDNIAHRPGIEHTFSETHTASHTQRMRPRHQGAFN